jgi:hypothetical protein
LSADDQEAFRAAGWTAYSPESLEKMLEDPVALG